MKALQKNFQRLVSGLGQIVLNDISRKRQSCTAVVDKRVDVMRSKIAFRVIIFFKARA